MQTGNVCELDIIFNFHKAYYILDELFIGGHLQETSKAEVLRICATMDEMMDESKDEGTNTFIHNILIVIILIIIFIGTTPGRTTGQRNGNTR